MQIRSSRNYCILFSIIILLHSHSIFSGNSITIPSKKYSSITHALAKAKSGDTIWVKEGIYRRDWLCQCHKDIEIPDFDDIVRSVGE